MGNSNLYKCDNSNSSVGSLVFNNSNYLSISILPAGGIQYNCTEFINVVGVGKYAGVNLPSFHHAADGWGNIANCFVVCSSITKCGVTACQYDTGCTTFPRWENYLRWKHKAAENWINISPKLLVLNWIALICLLRKVVCCCSVAKKMTFRPLTNWPWITHCRNVH